MVLPKILSAAEAIAVFVFSIILIIKPGEQHSLSHMDLLTVELIAGPLILLIDESLQYRKKKKAEGKGIAGKEGESAVESTSDEEE